MSDDCKTIDPLVTPFVDGELPPDDRRRVEQHVTVCPPCQSRVAAERAVHDAVASHRSHFMPCAPPLLRARCEAAARRERAELPPPVRRAGGLRRLWPASLAPLALAASLVVLVGSAFVYQLTDSSSTAMAAELTADHLKCFALNAVIGTHDSPAAVEAAMFTGFGWKMHLPSNPSRIGLELVGSRRCLYGEGTVAHVMYRHEGRPVSLFMLPKSARAEQFVEVLGHEAKIWCVGDRTLVLIAREPRRQVEELASFVQASLSQQP